MLVDENVGWLEVAMDDSSGVGGRQSTASSQKDVEDLRAGQGLP